MFQDTSEMLQDTIVAILIFFLFSLTRFLAVKKAEEKLTDSLDVNYTYSFRFV